MVESDKHREVRGRLESILSDAGLSFFSSHDPVSSGSGPALYIKDPRVDDRTRTGCQISQPDIVVNRGEGLDIIEIEKRAKNPKYILGDIYGVHMSKFYSDVEGELRKMDDRVRLFIMIAERKPEKGSKVEQYDNLIEGIDLENGSLDEVELFWLDEIDRLKETF